MARETIVLSRTEIAQRIDPQDVIESIQRAMGAFERGDGYLPPKAIYNDLPIDGPGVSLSACIVGHTQLADLLTMKLGHERAGNRTRDLPTTLSWIHAFDLQTGELLMICDGGLPTMLRTAAAAAVATRQLARPEAKTLCIIGAGQLGRQCLRTVTRVRDFEQVYLCDAQPEFAQQVAREVADEIKIPIEVTSPEIACPQSDVIVTATNSTEPIVRSEWVRPGTHLSCMGTDVHDKIECEMELLRRCRLFADSIEHASQRGEASQAIAAGLLPKDCYAGTLGQVINRDLPGRTSADEITLFDGVGLGIQDTTVARTLYDQAREQGLGTRISFA